MIFDLMTWVRSTWPPGCSGDPIGYVASGLVLLTFTMKSMLPLRIAAILSNFAFIYYAIVVGVTPVLILHAILLPVNVVRIMQIAGSADMARPFRTVKLALALLVFIVLGFGLSEWLHPVSYPAMTMPDWPLGSI